MKRYSPITLVGITLTILLAPCTGTAEEIVIQSTQPLDFGTFVAGNGGSVTIDPSGARSSSGDVRLLPSNEGTPAQFIVRGDPNATYTIQLPSGETVRLEGAGRAMAISSFTSSPSGAGGRLNGGGLETLSVGGTLLVGSGQKPGAASSVGFTVIVDYN